MKLNREEAIDFLRQRALNDEEAVDESLSKKECPYTKFEMYDAMLRGSKVLERVANELGNYLWEDFSEAAAKWVDDYDPDENGMYDSKELR